MKTIGILVFEDVEELDFVGPLEVFGTAARFGTGCRTIVIAETVQSIRGRNGLTVVPDVDFENAPDLQLLIVPGGLGARTHARQNAAILQFVRAQTGLVASVCTGALILAEAGLLRGETATTHHNAFEELGPYAGLSLRRSERYVIGERVASSAGVSAGIDLSLALLAKFWGAEIASKVAENLEWNKTLVTGEG